LSFVKVSFHINCRGSFSRRKCIMLLNLWFQGTNNVTEMSDIIHREFWVHYKSFHLTDWRGCSSQHRKKHWNDSRNCCDKKTSYFKSKITHWCCFSVLFNVLDSGNMLCEGLTSTPLLDFFNECNRAHFKYVHICIQFRSKMHNIMPCLRRYESEALQWWTATSWPRHKTRIWLWEWAQQTGLPFRELLPPDSSLCTVL